MEASLVWWDAHASQYADKTDTTPVNAHDWRNMVRRFTEDAEARPCAGCPRLARLGECHRPCRAFRQYVDRGRWEPDSREDWG